MTIAERIQGGKETLAFLLSVRLSLEPSSMLDFSRWKGLIGVFTVTDRV